MRTLSCTPMIHLNGLVLFYSPTLYARFFLKLTQLKNVLKHSFLIYRFHSFGDSIYSKVHNIYVSIIQKCTGSFE